MHRFVVLAFSLLAAAPALAQDEAAEAPLGVSEGGLDVRAGIELMSDYRFRGVSRSDEDPALQASVTLAHDSGLYAGARGTTLQGTDSFRLRDPAFGDLGDGQLDLYVGYGGNIGGGFEVDGGVLYEVFIGADGASDYVEPYASLSYLIGPVYATAGAKYAPSQDAIGDEDMLYLFGQLEVSIPFRPWSFTAHAGHQDWGMGRCGLPRSPQPCPGGTVASPSGGYWTWSLGVEHRVQALGLSGAYLGARYVDTDLPSRSGQDAGLAVYARLEF